MNKSLTGLTDVFTGLGQKIAYIPFRNSKLTYFLQPALCGDGKTMMLVNVSPTHESHFETLCSLRFASGVSKIELGRAVRNVTEASVEAKKNSNTGGGAKGKAAAAASSADGDEDKSPAPADKKTGPAASRGAASKGVAKKK